MDSDLIRTARRVRFLGVAPEVHESLASTNHEAFRRAQEGAPEGLVVVAGHQTSGQGRLGRTWFDQPDRSLMLSILLRPPLPVPSFPLLSLAGQFLLKDLVLFGASLSLVAMAPAGEGVRERLGMARAPMA